MTLSEAVASGKSFKRAGMDEYYSFEEYQDIVGFDTEDVLATDYELAPESSIGFTKAAFDAAWDAARAGTLSIKPAGQSEFYKKLVATLGL
jgi:hypothetical protein